MKIRLSELRRIIRDTIEEQAWVPGRWYPGTGEPVSDDEVEAMGQSGLGQEDEEGDDLNEASISPQDLKKASYADINDKFPDFIEYLNTTNKEFMSTATFAVSPQGFMGLGRKVPVVALRKGPAISWEDGKPNFRTSPTFIDAIRNAK